jgi:hypothetical protein
VTQMFSREQEAANGRREALLSLCIPAFSLAA